jgi:hypothetical protein
MNPVSLNNYKKDTLYPSVVKAVAKLLNKQNEMGVIDVFLEMGNLTPKDFDAWQNGRIPYLEKVFQGSLSKANRILRIIGFHMHDLNMVTSIKTYRLKRGKNVLSFSKSGIKDIEESYSRLYRWNRSEEINQANNTIRIAYSRSKQAPPIE